MSMKRIPRPKLDHDDHLPDPTEEEKVNQRRAIRAYLNIAWRIYVKEVLEKTPRISEKKDLLDDGDIEETKERP